VHAEPGEGLDVGVAVVERVHVLVQGADVDEAVREVEVDGAVERDGQREAHRPRDVLLQHSAPPSV